MSINVVAYDPRWTEWFARERALLERVLSPWLSDGVHHIGSTSVPGLAAKPIIDMIAGVRDLTEARAAIVVLEAHDYVHAPHRPRAHWFYKPSSPHWHPTPDDSGRLTAGSAPLRPLAAEHTHALHLTEPGSDLWRERLAFRDALRGDPVLREEYQALKLRLARAHGDDIAAYTADKRDFVARVLAGAGIALAPRAGGTATA